MKAAPGIEAIQDRLRGALFLAGFSALWLCAALAEMHNLDLASALAAALLFGILAMPALWLRRRLPAAPPSSSGRALGRSFAWINLAQWTAVLLVAAMLVRFHRQAYILPAVVAIVGLHFFPLARLFHYRIHSLTGALMLGWAIAVVVSLPRDRVPVLAALGASAILWFSGAYAIRGALHAARTLLHPRPR